MQLRLCNRSQYPTHVRLLSLDQFATIARTKIEELERMGETEQKTSSSMVGHELCDSPATLAANLKSTVANALMEKVNVAFQLPVEPILLPARDDLAEYELTAPQSLKEDPKYFLFAFILPSLFTFFIIISNFPRAVLSRRGNKVVISTPLTVLQDDATEMRAGFVFEFGAV